MRRLVTLLFFAAVLLTACGSSIDQQSTGEWQYSFADSTGEEVILSSRPQRVAVLFSSYAEIWTLAGGKVAVTVGETLERGFSPEDTLLVDGGAGKTIDLELLLAAQPDFVIGSADIPAQADACRRAAQAGIPAALFRVDTFGDYLRMLKVCTDITGDTEAYRIYGTDVEQKISSLLKAVEAREGEKREILFIRAGSSYSATKAKRAPDNFVCIMLEELGAYNIADDAAVLLDGLSLEEIMLRDPDCIFISTMGNEEASQGYILELFTQDGWRELAAVRNENYIFLPRELFHFKPNARWADAYCMLAQYLYPELNCYE